MTNRLFIAGAALGLLLVGGCATPPPADTPPAATETQPAVQLEARDQITATAFVASVNLERRELVLRGKGNKLHVISVGDEVRNLAQIKSGDRINFTYYEALALDLERSAPGTPFRRERMTADQTAPNQQPAGMASKHMEMVAKVTKMNKQKRKVTLQSTTDAVTLRIPQKIDLSKLRIGDQVRANYVQELAISVEPVTPGRARRR